MTQIGTGTRIRAGTDQEFAGTWTGFYQVLGLQLSAGMVEAYRWNLPAVTLVQTPAHVCRLEPNAFGQLRAVEAEDDGVSAGGK
ncbi:MAG: hypothetical protein FJ405_00510 [Verrucomicrobia bacterium]|nr:hypothetical protein [Verrucomicrobiota bacterium]